MADDDAFARRVRAFYEAHNPERLDLVPLGGAQKLRSKCCVLQNAFEQ